MTKVHCHPERTGEGSGFGRLSQILRGVPLSMTVWVLLVLSSTAFAQTHPTTQPTPHKAAVVVLEGPIDDYSRDMLFKRFADARAVGADTIILRIDTYGGLVTAGLDISRFIKAQSDLHTIAFVHGKAISAGAMIAMACD